MTLERYAGQRDSLHWIGSKPILILKHPLLEAAYRKSRRMTLDLYLERQASHHGAGKLLFAARHPVLAAIRHRVGGEFQDARERLEGERRARLAYRLNGIAAFAEGVGQRFGKDLPIALSCAQLLADKCGTKTAEHARTLVTALESTGQQANRLQAYARREMPDTAPVDINELIRKAVPQGLADYNKEKKITVFLKLAEGSMVADASDKQLAEALVELGRNAIAALPLKSSLFYMTEAVVLDEKFAASRLHLLKPGRYVRISVTDTRPDMGKDAIAQAFEPPFSAEDRWPGLPGVYGIIISHGGYLEIEISTGCSSIIVYLPLKERRGSASPAPPPPAAKQ